MIDETNYFVQFNDKLCVIQDYTSRCWFEWVSEHIWLVWISIGNLSTYSLISYKLVHIS